jgi:hypothetical protein
MRSSQLQKMKNDHTQIDMKYLINITSKKCVAHKKLLKNIKVDFSNLGM